MSHALAPATGSVQKFWNPARRRLLLGLTVYKLILFAFLLCALKFFPFFNQVAYENCIHWPREGPRTLATSFATWDGAHYLFLSEVGYEKDSPSCAFYPLWPMLMRAGSYLTFHNHFIAGMLLANLLSVIGVLLFHYFVTLHHGAETANLSVLLLLAFPGALFFSFIYTESLFFLLIILFFLFLFQENYLGVAVVGFFLPLTKAIGIFCIFPLLCHLLLKPARTAGAIDNQTREPSPFARQSSIVNRKFLALIGPVLGYACYFLFMHSATGNAFEGFQAQRFYPNQPSISHIFDIEGFLEALFMPLEMHGTLDSAIDRGLFLLLLPSLYLIFRLNKVYFAYAWFVGLVPAMSSWFFSYNRNFMMCFPLFIALASLLTNGAHRILFWYLVMLPATVQIWFLLRHVNFVWAG